MKLLIAVLMLLISSYAGAQQGGFSGSGFPSLNESALQAFQGPITTPSINQELYGPNYNTPELAVAAACSSTSKEVYFPAGVYHVTSGMQACSGLHIRCAAPSFKAQSTGVVFQLQSGLAIWGLYNPNANAQVTAGAGSITDLEVDGCGFDLTQDSAALGAMQIKGIGQSHFYYNTFFTNNNANPVITLDGGNYAYNYGDYDNVWVGNNGFDNDAAVGSDIGLYFTNTQTTGGSNSNSFYGGSWVRFGTDVLIDSGNNNNFYAVDLENFNNYGIHLTTNGSVGGAAGQNNFYGVRVESSAGSRTGILVDASAVGNSIINPYFSGAFTYVTDTSGLTTCVGCFYGTNPTSTTTFSGLSSGTPYHNVGVGAQPACLDGWAFNCLFVAGEVSANKNITLGSTNGGYDNFVSQATAPRLIIWPDLAGSVLLSGGNIPLSATGTATPSSNFNSANLVFQSSYNSGTLTSGAYSSGITASGTGTCNLASFNGGGTGATATVPVVGGVITAGTSLTITAHGSGYTSTATTATASSGTATCSGTATVVTLVSAQDSYLAFASPEAGANPTVDWIFEASGSSGVHRALIEGINLYLYNTAAATSGANQAAPYFEYLGSYWNGTASASDVWKCAPTMGTGSNPSSSINCSHTGTTGLNFWQFPGVVSGTLGTATNCSSVASPAVCGSAASGSVAVATGTNSTLVVNTTAVTANSQILITFDASLGTKLGITCNTTITPYWVQARTAGTSFTLGSSSLLTNPGCFSYTIIN